MWEILPNILTLVAHLKFYKLIFEGCAVWIISVTSPESQCSICAAIAILQESREVNSNCSLFNSALFSF